METEDDMENFDGNDSDDENIYPPSSQEEYSTEHETESEMDNPLLEPAETRDNRYYY